MVATAAFFFASLVAFASAKSTLVLHEQRDVPEGYTVTGKANPATKLNLRLGLALRDFAGLEKALYDVSTPSSKSYGQHLNRDEVKSHMSPTSETLKAVNDWLASNNIKSKALPGLGDWIGFSTTVKDAESLFGADFKVFKHLDTGKEEVRTLSYSIPAELQGHLEVAHPMTTFPNPYKQTPKVSSPSAFKLGPNAPSSLASSCSSSVTPACLQSLYGIPSKPANSTEASIGVTGYIDQYPQKADLKTFLKKYRTDITSTTTFTLQTLDGGSDPQKASSAGIEANLDVQYTVGLATGVPVYFISVGDNYQDGDLEGFLDTINFISGESSPPSVLTTSYGQNENTMSRALATKLCQAYASIGAQGVSILFASGDGGVSGSQSGSCTKFVPTFPSGCPYMTSVGATQGGSPETGASLSAGGFSNYFAAPSYQTTNTQAYIKSLGSTYSGKYNATGRGYPDVAAQGVSVNIVSGGELEPVDGTSCASPIFASVIGLLNNELAAAGKPALGFLNPWLYSTAASALNDITSGSNTGCNTKGFSAKAGWDPITGLGSPNYAKLRTAAGL